MKNVKNGDGRSIILIAYIETLLLGIQIWLTDYAIEHSLIG